MSYQIETRRKAFTAIPIDELLPAPHIHSHVELIYLTQGESVAVLDNREYTFRAGECFIAFPNQIHFYYEQQPVQGYLVIFTPELFQELRKLFQTKLPINPVCDMSSYTYDMNECMEQMCLKLETESMYDEMVAKGQLLMVLGGMFSDMQLEDNPGDQDTMKRILTYCLDNYMKPVTLATVAKELYLSKYYISHVFRERMQVGFKDFMNQLRVEYSCGLLGKGSSITEIAYASGFASVRTYNRAFMKVMHMTPREYAKWK